MSKSRAYLVPLLAATAAALIVGLQVRLIGDWRVDDAYISFAFSKNLANGRGLIFSYDQRVEGYTNFLWTVVNALPIKLWPNADPLIAARIMCFVALGGLLLATWRVSRLFVGQGFAAIGVICLAAWTDLTRAALSGLESVPHAALLAFGILAYLRELSAERKHSLWWFVTAALTRISGIANVAFVGCFELLVRATDRKLDLRSLVRWALPPLLLLGGYFAWRFNYYGLLLPTTYYAKTLVMLGDPDRGQRYVWDAIRDLGLLAVLPFAAVAVFRRCDRRLLFLCGALLFETVYMMHVGGDWMPFNRFCIPVAAPLMVLFVTGMSEVWQASSPGRARVASGALLAVTLTWVLLHVDSHVIMTPQEQGKVVNAEHVKQHTNENLLENKRFFNAIIRKPGDVLVTDYGGVLGYYTDASLIEMWGLCNRDIALFGNAEGINPIYGKTCIKCYKRFDPDYFHIVTPIVRDARAFASHRDVVNQIFQAGALEGVLHLRKRYATGRVLDLASQRALFFIEKRKPGNALVPRTAAGGFTIDYPFEPGGATSLAAR